MEYGGFIHYLSKEGDTMNVLLVMALWVIVGLIVGVVVAQSI